MLALDREFLKWGLRNFAYFIYHATSINLYKRFANFEHNKRLIDASFRVNNLLFANKVGLDAGKLFFVAKLPTSCALSSHDFLGKLCYELRVFLVQMTDVP